MKKISDVVACYIKFLLTFVLLNATLILAQEYSCGEKHNYIRIGDGIMLTELWKPIKGYEGFYEISNFGKVKSINRLRFNSNAVIKRKFLHFSVYNNRYKIRLQKNKTMFKTFWIHQLVWDAFGNIPRNKGILQIDHIDNNSFNNRIDNLQLLSHRSNCIKRSEILRKVTNYTGVYLLPAGKYRRKTDRWGAQITIKNKHIYLGLFDTEYEAHLAYEKKKEEILWQV